LIPSYHHGVITMLSTINFDDQATLAATEIGDEIPDRKLAAELKAGQLAFAQTSPQLLFSRRQVTPQRPRHLMNAFTRMCRSRQN